MFTLSLVLFVRCVVGLSVGSVAHTDIEDFTDYRPTEIKLSDCGSNEVLSQCVGCPPEDSCYDRNQIACPAAFLGCSPGCVCKEGFIRKTLRSECIPKEECGAPCVIFEQYTECKERLNETCSSIASPSKSNSASEQACTPGCGCWNGYYRADEKSPCLHRCSCPELEDTPECVYWRTPVLG